MYFAKGPWPYAGQKYTRGVLKVWRRPNQFQLPYPTSSFVLSGVSLFVRFLVQFGPYYSIFCHFLPFPNRVKGIQANSSNGLSVTEVNNAKSFLVNLNKKIGFGLGISLTASLSQKNSDRCQQRIAATWSCPERTNEDNAEQAQSTEWLMPQGSGLELRWWLCLLLVLLVRLEPVKRLSMLPFALY